MLRIRRTTPAPAHVVSARWVTGSMRPQYLSISGMNGSPSSAPLASRVAKISEALRTRTVSPGFRSRILAFCSDFLVAVFTLPT